MGGCLPILGPSSGHGAQLIGLVQAQGIVPIAVQLDLHGLAQEVNLYRSAVTVLGLHKSALLRHFFNELLIGLLLIAQTAH